MSSRIRTSAPTRLDFAGAPTDVEPFRSEEGGYVVNASLGLRASVSVELSGDRSDIVITSLDGGVEERFASIEALDLEGDLRLLKAAIAHVSLDQGMRVTTGTDVPRGSGLGASAALAVALLSALRQLKGEQPSPHELVHDALHVENVMMGNINGGQDQYAAALGGFHAFDFGARVDVQSVAVSPECLQSLEERSLLCYSGDARLSGHVLDQVMADYKNGDGRTVSALRDMRRFAQEMVMALSERSLDDFGALIRAVGERQRDFHPVMTPPAVEGLFRLGQAHGALGSKMVGAGGGGCVFFFCAPERKQELHDALVTREIQVLPVQFSQMGVETSL